ncbi:MAG: UDP-N-acetylglucosamine:LPS N-acetylglucosamine transferase [Frankiales bacterium]|nr:UDP-N-acetylglucosamine:LPS N-acetylglucosamine transferase [Frankiales bacterium]
MPRRPQHPSSSRRLPQAPRVLVVSGSVGAGHDGAAAELAARLRARGAEVDVRDFLDAVPRLWRRLLRDGYTWSVLRAPGIFDWLFDRVEDCAPVRALALLSCRTGDPAVREWLRAGRYDLVVSTYPFASQCLGGLRVRGELQVPVATYVTDPAVHRTWVHDDVDLHLCVTEATATHPYGVDVVPAGPLVPDRFRRHVGRSALAAVRRELELPTGQPVALLSTGSLGLGDVVPAAAALADAGVLPLVLCGRSAALRAAVAGVPGAVALGWRDDVHVLMQLADVLVHNAGGLSFTESLEAGLPAVSYRCIPGHGQANAEVLERSGLAPWARDEASLVALVLAAAARPRVAPPARPDPADLLATLLPALARPSLRSA